MPSKDVANTLYLRVYSGRYRNWQEPVEIVVEIPASKKQEYGADPSYWAGVVFCVEQEISEQDP